MATIVGFVLRSSNKERTAYFYEVLGLKTEHHQHGGPMHYEVSQISPDFVLEIYKRSDEYLRDAIMVQVESIELALEAVAKFGIFPNTNIIQAQDIRFIYVSDPDGRDVMLVEL